MKYVKILFISLISILGCESDQKKKQNLYQFIPQNTQAIIIINEGSLFKEAWHNSSSIKSLSPEEEETKVLISLIKNTSETSSILCFSPTGKEKFSSILIQRNKKDTLQSDSKYSNYSGVNIRKTQIEGIIFFKIQINESEIISDSKLIIENIIRNYQSKQLGIYDKDFYQLIDNLEAKSDLIGKGGLQLW